ncbi:MAG: DUF192 domain-containing protein [Nitrososphaerota archaeon]
MNVKRQMAILILFLISAIVLVLVQISSTLNQRVTREFRKMETAKIKIVNDEDKILELEVRIADEPDERAAGFQNISRSVVEKTLILFIFPEEGYVFFHMRNVEASLDIAFIKADGRIIEIMRMDPDPNRLYAPNESFKYAIEAPLGFFQSKKITAGKSRLIVESIPEEN